MTDSFYSAEEEQEDREFSDFPEDEADECTCEEVPCCDAQCNCICHSVELED